MHTPQKQNVPIRIPVLALSVPAAGMATGRSRARMFELIRSGQIKAKKDGASTIITVDELNRWLSTLPERTAA